MSQNKKKHKIICGKEYKIAIPPVEKFHKRIDKKGKAFWYNEWTKDGLSKVGDVKEFGDDDFVIMETDDVPIKVRVENLHEEWQ